MAAGTASSKRVIYAALAGNLAIAITKFAAAWWSGSSAMLTEGVHSLVDTGNELLLLYGLRRAAAPPTLRHPLGHGRELYFWSFIVALQVFALGAGVSIYQGFAHLRAPAAATSLGVNLAVLGLSFLFEAGSWWVALKEFRAAKGDQTYWQAIRRSKDPTTFMVLAEDSAALIGLAIAAVGVTLAEVLGRPELDGIASIGIGVVLAGTALLLAREAKGLLIGEAAVPGLNEAILAIARTDPAVRSANGVITVHLAPDQVVASLSLEFEDRLTTPDIEACVDRIEKAIRASRPEVRTLFIKPQTAGTFERLSRIRAGAAIG